MGIGKDSHINSLSNWTEDSSVPVFADESPFNIWSDWNASQRDLFVLDQNGDLLLQQNITSGIPDNLNELIQNSLSVNNTALNPIMVKVYQNFPNPFNPTTTIHYTSPPNLVTKILIYDLLGNVINSFTRYDNVPGRKYITWNATNYVGQKVSSGIYFFSVETGGMKQTRKMILLD